VLGFVLRRLLLLIPTVLGVSVVTFALVHLVPGDPASFAGQDADGGVAADVDAAALAEGFRRRYLLDQPLWKQYLHYLGPFDLSERGHAWFGGSGERPWHGVLALDLGTEQLRPEVDIASELLRRLAITLPMTGLALLLAYALAIPLGVHAATRRGTVTERGTTALLFALYALPAFWAALLLQASLGGAGLGWLPTLGLASSDAGELTGLDALVDRLKHLVLPVTCYAYGSLAYLSRQMRAGMIEVVSQDFVRTARAKGLPERTVVWKHALRSSLVPLVTLFGSVLPALVGGSVVVETVFDVPGMGLYVYESLLRREVDAVLGAVLLGAVTTVAGILVSDVLHAWIDPRVRPGRAIER
jgi:peptide/nickel transport system permease protein